VIGIGLIGSSVLRAARQFGLARELVAYDASEAVRARLKVTGIADEVADSAAAAAAGCDAVIVAVPPGACGGVAAEIAAALKPGALVSDVSSVKAAVVAAMHPHLPDGVHFVPAHPVAGTEESGPDSGFAELFAGRWCILTPPGTEPAAVERAAAFWRGAGCNVEMMTPEHHDLVLAITSHVPHLIAYNIVGTAADLEEVTQSEVIKFSAGGFRDFTRIAASDPTMWRDVFLLNRDAVLEMLGRFVEDLTALQRSIRWGDGDQLFDLFTRTRAIRRSIVDLGQDAVGPDFGRPHGALPAADALDGRKR
jgi:cyclohexadieny/prephenate dehydrogenase